MAKNDSKEAAKSKKSAAADKGKKKGGVKQYFKELKSELKKVVWPTRKQVQNNTGVVLAVMAAMGIFLFAVDSGLGAAIKALLSIGS